MEKLLRMIKETTVPVKICSGEVLKGEIDNVLQCYYLEEGYGVVNHVNSSAPLYTINGPGFFGMNQLLNRQNTLNLKIIKNSTVYPICSDAVLTMIKEKDMWSELAMHLSNIIHQINIQNTHRTKISATERIFNALKMLEKEDETVRLSYKAIDYARDITGLSYSTVLRGIEFLKRSEKIKLRNGVLLEVNFRRK